MVEILASGVVLATYAGIAFGQIPRLRMNRATIGVVGAAALVAIGAISEQQALDAIDVGTLLLLAAMMVINVNLRMAGFFRFVATRTLYIAHTPRMLLALVIVSSGFLSALFLNDTICLMFTPLIVDIALQLKRNPMPYLIGLATATNVGSVATITGNPQNIIIGQSSGISYLTFLAYLGPVAIIGLCICWIVIVLLHPEEFRSRLPEVEILPTHPYPPLLVRVLLVVSSLVIAFLVGAPIVTSACVAAATLLISRLRPGKLLNLDWELLILFVGLFVVTGTIEATGLSEQLFRTAAPFMKAGVLQLSIVTGILSNLVSNVPAVLLLRPEMAAFPNSQQAWLTLAMSSTLAGNFTLLGSAASLIVAEIARGRGVMLSFAAFLRAGIPITLLTTSVGIVWLSLVN
jgi:Na+/H+ antiporter NhaD/arsenite permease-like protein